MDVVRSWTGKEAKAFRTATRMSLRDFAAYLGMSPRAISYWEAGGSEIVPAASSQEILDAALELANHEVRERFSSLVQQDADLEEPLIEPGPDHPAVPGTPTGEIRADPQTVREASSPWGRSSNDRTSHLTGQLRQNHALPYHPPEPAIGTFETFLASPDRALLIVGPPGTGKTSLALHLAKRLPTSAFVQLHNGTSWSPGTDLAREILRYDSRPAGDDPLLTLEHALASASATTVVIIDGLDTPARLDAAAAQCDTLIRHIYDNRLRFILCLRTPPIPDLARFPLLQASLHPTGSRPGIILDRWDERTASSIWSEHSHPNEPTWDRLPQPLRRMARTPLLMQMIKTEFPHSHADSGNTYTLIEQWLHTRHAGEPTLIEHDILDDFAQARQHLEEIRTARDLNRTNQLLNTLASASQSDARARETFALTIAGIAHHSPELLSSAALSPRCEAGTTLPLILEIASDHDLPLNREVVRTAAAQALHSHNMKLAIALLHYHRSAMSDSEQAQWISEALNHYGSHLWPAINTHLATASGTLATTMLARLDLRNSEHAIYLARYLSSRIPLAPATMTTLRTHPDWRVRAALAEAAADHDPANTATTAALAHDPDYKVRSRLAEVICRLRGIEPEPILKVLLADPNWYVRTTLIQSAVRETAPEHLQLRTMILENCRSPEWQDCPPTAAAALAELAMRTKSDQLPADAKAVTNPAEGGCDDKTRGVRSQSWHVASAPPAAGTDSYVAQRDPRWIQLPGRRQLDRSEYRRLRGRRALQIALDLYDLDQAKELAVEIAMAGADFIEIGDPLIKANGVAAIEAIKNCAPDTLIVAEMMSADWGRNQIDLAATAGADAVLLIGPASTASMRQATSAASKYDLPVTLDIPPANRNVHWVRQAEQAGIDGFTITTNIDLGIAGPTPMDQLEQARPHTQRPIAVSGGFSLSDPEIILNADWDILIVGRAIVEAIDPAHATRQLLDLIDHPTTPKE